MVFEKIQYIVYEDGDKSDPTNMHVNTLPTHNWFLVKASADKLTTCNQICWLPPTLTSIFSTIVL